PLLLVFELFSIYSSPGRCFLCYFLILIFFFFFQAEDGIRVFHVTGVQTCALPISPIDQRLHRSPVRLAGTDPAGPAGLSVVHARSEERRVGKECRSRWSAEH